MWLQPVMRALRFTLAVLLLVLLASTLDQAHAQTVDGIEQAWRAWMANYGRKGLIDWRPAATAAV